MDINPIKKADMERLLRPSMAIKAEDFYIKYSKDEIAYEINLFLKDVVLFRDAYKQWKHNPEYKHYFKLRHFEYSIMEAFLILSYKFMNYRYPQRDVENFERTVNKAIQVYDRVVENFNQLYKPMKPFNERRPW
jgi:phosphoglycerol transferase MdoB-like AlkP superfamily enzyme